MYLMRQKGKLKRVWSTGTSNSRFSRSHEPRAPSAVCFDGQFIWGTVFELHSPPRLVVIDPATEKSWAITAADGLPLLTAGDRPENIGRQTLSIAAISPGQICVAGSFGRTWLAMVRFAPSEGVTVNVFHEAKDLTWQKDREQWRSTHVAFYPTHMFLLEDPSVKDMLDQRRLVVGRAGSGVDLLNHPLIVDPKSLEVEVFAEKFWAEKQPLDIWQQGGAVYFVDSIPPRYNEMALMRLGLPGPKIDVVLTLPKEGYPIFFDRKWYVSGKQWWTVDLESQSIVSAGPVPWSFSNRFSADTPVRKEENQLVLLASSHHYGLLAAYTTNSGKQILIQVHFQSALPLNSAERSEP